jgi:hypothetical protein
VHAAFVNPGKILAYFIQMSGMEKGKVLMVELKQPAIQQWQTLEQTELAVKRCGRNCRMEL